MSPHLIQFSLLPLLILIIAACAETTPPAPIALVSPTPAATRTPGPPLPQSDKPPVEVQVTLSEFKITMSQTAFPANTPITFVVTNAGKIPHQFVIELPTEVNAPLLAGTQRAEIENINPGEKASLTWIFTQTQQYRFACHVPGHFEAGMVNQASAQAHVRLYTLAEVVK